MTRPTGCPFDPAARDELLEICRRTFGKPRADGTLARQFHAKTHACLAGTLTLDPPDLPAVRHGLFAQAGRYEVLARFSNSFFDNDRDPDLRGLAIKVMGVSGSVVEGAPPGQQDWVMMNESIGPSRDAEEAMDLFRALDGFPRKTAAQVLALRYVVPDWRPWRIRWRYLGFLGLSGLHNLLVRDLLQSTYNTVTPYRLGEGAMKVILRPDDKMRSRRPARGKDFRAKLQSALDAGPVGFELCVQPRLLEDDPLEDARVAWKSPIHRVGRLEFGKQDVAASVALGEGLAFSPWHALEAHAPLGSVNALRRDIYAASARNRGAVVEPPE